jgi:hypothetical protein
MQTQDLSRIRAFRIQPHIYTQVIRAAERMKLNRSEYIRRALVEQLKRDAQDSA